MLAGKLAILFSSLPCTITKITIAMSLKMAEFFFVCLYVSDTGSDQVSLSQCEYFLFGKLLKFGSFFDVAFCKNIAQKN